MRRGMETHEAVYEKQKLSRWITAERQKLIQMERDPRTSEKGKADQKRLIEQLEAKRNSLN
jgi:hypothetical protein